MTFRKRKSSDTWHFMPSCSNWPTRDFEQRSDKPKSGELCDQCKAKARKAKKR